MKAATAALAPWAKSASLPRFGRSEHQRPVLGADGVVGRHHAGGGVAGDLRAVDEIEDGVAGPEIQDEAAERAFDLLVARTAGAAHDRRDFRERHRGLRQLRGRKHRAAAALERGFGERNHFDHALIGLARGLREGEDAVLVQDQADRTRRRRECPRRLLGETEARHDVGHDAHAAVIKFGGPGLAVGLVDQAQHGGGMGVIDEALGNEGMQQRFDRRVGRHRVEQIGALRPHHLLVRHGIALEQHAQLGEPHRRQPGRLDHGHVGARALDAEHIDLAPHQVGQPQFHRRVAAAVQHETGIAAEQARGVDPQREVARHPPGAIAIHHRLGLVLHEAALHVCSPMTGIDMHRLWGCQQGPAQVMAARVHARRSSHSALDLEAVCHESNLPRSSPVSRTNTSIAIRPPQSEGINWSRSDVGFGRTSGLNDRSNVRVKGDRKSAVIARSRRTGPSRSVPWKCRRRTRTTPIHLLAAAAIYDHDVDVRYLAAIIASRAWPNNWQHGSAPAA